MVECLNRHAAVSLSSAECGIALSVQLFTQNNSRFQIVSGKGPQLMGGERHHLVRAIVAE